MHNHACCYMRRHFIHLDSKQPRHQWVPHGRCNHRGMAYHLVHNARVGYLHPSLVFQKDNNQLYGDNDISQYL